MNVPPQPDHSGPTPPGGPQPPPRPGHQESSSAHTGFHADAPSGAQGPEPVERLYPLAAWRSRVYARGVDLLLVALPALLSMPDDRSLVRWERARAAHALGDAKAAAREVRAFADLAGGHHAMGRLHSGVLLGQLTAESGDVHGAIRILRMVRAEHPKVEYEGQSYWICSDKAAEQVRADPDKYLADFEG